MNFGYTVEQEALRQEVLQFIAENLTPEVKEEMAGGGEVRRGRHLQAFNKKVVDRGWIGISGPNEYGDQAGSTDDQYIYEEEFRRNVGAGGGGGRGR